MIYNVSWARLKPFARSTIVPSAQGPADGEINAGEPATWFSYMSKLIAFGKVAGLDGRAAAGSFEQPPFA